MVWTQTNICLVLVLFVDLLMIRTISSVAVRVHLFNSFFSLASCMLAENKPQPENPAPSLLLLKCHATISCNKTHHAIPFSVSPINTCTVHSSVRYGQGQELCLWTQIQEEMRLKLILMYSVYVLSYVYLLWYLFIKKK